MGNENVSVLLIDDEEIIVETITSYLEETNFIITGLSDPKEALRLIKKKTYDIVLTDLMMPEVSGMDIVKAVKKTGYDTQVIIFTGFAAVDTAIEAVQLGVYDYIRKPLELKKLKVILDRSAEKLYLQRENIDLHKRIKKMLTDITMLYDISSILYQMPDFDIAIDMVLDTLTEGMKIRKVGIFLYDKSTGQYQIKKSWMLSKNFIKQFVFKIGDDINGVKVSLTDATIVVDLVKGMKIGDRQIKIDKDMNQILLIPIQYFDDILGFFGVFQIDIEFYTLEDEVKLLKILATQIAPIFQNISTKDKQYFEAQSTFDESIYKIIDSGITTSMDLESPVSFVLLRLVPVTELSNFHSCNELGLSLRKIVEDEFGSSVDIMWQNFDSLFIILQGKSYVNIELSCLNIERKIEELIIGDLNKPTWSVKYAIANSPMDGNSISDIVTVLRKRFFTEIVF